MKINRIEIDHFGKLNNFSLDFSDGLNFIYGYNEDGKSTILAFLRMMFYGNVGQSRDLASNARKKYKPWNGSTMGGVVEFESAGKHYRLEKRFGQTAGRDTTTLYNSDTGALIPLNSADEVGSSFFGVDLSGFERSVFIGRNGAFAGDSDKNDGITERLINLSTSSDEKVSLKRAESELVAAAEQLVSRRGNTGLLVEAREQLAELERKINATKANELSQHATREQYDTMLTVQQAEKQRLDAVRDQRNRIQSLRDELEEKKEQKILVEHRLELFEAEKKSHAEIAELNLKQAEERLNNFTRMTSAVKAESRKPIFAILAGASLSAALVLALVFKPIYGFVALLAPLFLAIELGLAGRRKKLQSSLEEQRINQEALENEFESLLEKNGREALEDEKTLEKLRADAAAVAEEVKHCESKLAGITRVAMLDNTLEDDIINREEQIAKLRSELSEPEVAVSVLIDRKAELLEKLDEYEKQYDAIKLALEVLENSAEELRRNFGPRLNERTAEIFNGLTGGRYKNVNVSKDYGIRVLEEGDIFYREGGYLSNGTIDQAYFALRLAIADLLAEESGEHLPLFLDDIFEQYDDKRTDDGLVFLKTYANEQSGQVMFFSCHKYLIDAAKKLTPEAEFKSLS